MANMGFVSSRFAGTDGVTLESKKWAEVLRDRGHQSYWFAGKLDTDPAASLLLPEAFFEHPDNAWINDRIWGRTRRTRTTTNRIHTLARKIKDGLYHFVKQFKIDFLVAENALTIPMNVPLGVALTEFLAETGMPAVAHHHDFYWERPRFLVNAVHDYLDMAFPPSFINIQHVVINSAGRDELAWRKGLSSILIPNVLDFENPARYGGERDERVRERLGVGPKDIMILQPTRVVPRKGIEHAITIASRLGDLDCKLIVTHESGDEGDDYMEALKEHAQDVDVDLRFIHTRLSDEDGPARKRNRFTLWDVYPCADLITYPSLYEGFGNAFLEAVLFKKPIVVNRYAIWIEDIEPKRFQAILMDGYVTGGMIEQIRTVLVDPSLRQKMVDRNFERARRHYSYSVLSRSLRTLVTNIMGLEQY